MTLINHNKVKEIGWYWRARGMHFDRVYTGTLARHAQTAHGIAKGMFFEQNSQGVSVSIESNAINFEGAAIRAEALNEYDSEALIASQLLRVPPPEPLPSPHTREGYKAHFRVLREGLKAWIAGDLTPQRMPSFANFREGLAHLAAPACVRVGGLLGGFEPGGLDRDVDAAVTLGRELDLAATEAGLAMSLREVMVGADEDGDGTIGTISDDGNSGNDPALGTSRFAVTSTTASGPVPFQWAGWPPRRSPHGRE